MTIQALLARAREIWGPRPIADSRDVIVPMGVVFGDICRWRRDLTPETTDEELKKELGNMIFSTIRWCDDLGFNPEECILQAIECQRRYVRARDTTGKP